MVVWFVVCLIWVATGFYKSRDTLTVDDYGLLKELEGYSLTVYLDTGGTPTVCYGHTGQDVAVGQPPRSEAQCGLLLEQDAVWASRAVSDLVTVPLNNNQRQALTSFVFNVGRQAFNDSTLLRLLNAGRYDDVPTQLRRWRYDNGLAVQGLINRRNREVNVWLGNG